MKKLFTLFALLVFAASASFAAETTTSGSLINKYTSGITSKEAQIRKDIADRQNAANKQAEANRAAREAKKQEINNKIQAHKDAQNAKKQEVNKKVQAKKDALNTLLSK